MRARKGSGLDEFLAWRKWGDETPHTRQADRETHYVNDIAVRWDITNFEKVIQTGWVWRDGRWWIGSLSFRIRR